MLRKLDVTGAVACFLAPTHAAQIRAALDRMRPEQAIVVLLPRIVDLVAMLQCEDFAQQIEAHRLWFVAGDDWPDQLLHLFREHTGLATPGQFIRVSASGSELIDELILRAQRVFSEITQKRAAVVQGMKSKLWNKPATTRLCVVAPTRFRLWNDVGDALVRCAQEACPATGEWTWDLFDADDPLSGSPLALGERAHACSAILTANTARCDLPGLLPEQLPWLTWLTGARMPSFSAAGPNDRLLLADPGARSVALRTGWPDSRIHIATWPRIPENSGAGGKGRASIAIIADTTALDPPDELGEYSSHTLLWDAIREQLPRDPFALGGDINSYLRRRMRELDISEQSFPSAIFMQRLICPAWQQGIARALIQAGVAPRLFGQGWSELEEFRSCAAGAVESREHLRQILGDCRAVVHALPTPHVHPIDFCGVNVLRPMGMPRSDFLQLAQASSGLRPDLAMNHVPSLDGSTLRTILTQF